MSLKEENQDLNEMEEKDHKTHRDFKTEEKSFSCSKAEETFLRKRARKSRNIGNLTCHLCGLTLKQQGNLSPYENSHRREALHLPSVWKEFQCTWKP